MAEAQGRVVCVGEGCGDGADAVEPATFGNDGRRDGLRCRLDQDGEDSARVVTDLRPVGPGVLDVRLDNEVVGTTRLAWQKLLDKVAE
nr:hypothetical protein [Promicromonospora thailandica]BFF20922.1 hypothetical protein GCM10025730_44430 [Promicromonospora thailandica]